MKYTVLGALLLVSGIVLLIFGGFQGGLLIVFPFIMTSSPKGALGSLLIMLGTVVLFFGMATEMMGYEMVEPEGTNVEKRGIGLVLIGPVPLIIDTKNRKLTLISLAIFITGIAILVFLFLM